MNTTTAVNSKTVFNATLKTTLLYPLPSGDSTAKEFADSLEAKGPSRVETKTGMVFESSPFSNIPYASQQAMSRTSSLVRALLNQHKVNRGSALTILNSTYNKLLKMDAGFAAHKGRNEATLVMEDITVSTRQGDFDSLLADREMSWDEMAMMTNANITRKDGAGEDEGRIQTALHDADQVLDFPTERLVFRGDDVKASLWGLEWPQWDEMLEARAERVLSALESIRNKADREAYKVKWQKRLLVASHPLAEATGMYAPWAINGWMRSIWRDKQVLLSMLTRYEDASVRLDTAVADEIRSGRPASLTRIMTEAPFEPREAYILGDTVIEAVEDSAYYIQVMPEAWVLTTKWYDQLRTHIEARIKQEDALYAHLTTLQDTLDWYWAETDGDRPKQAPVYWNRDGFYLTELDALAAFGQEQAEAAERVIVNDKQAFLAATEGLFA